MVNIFSIEKKSKKIAKNMIKNKIFPKKYVPSYTTVYKYLSKKYFSFTKLTVGE